MKKLKPYLTRVYLFGLLTAAIVAVLAQQGVLKAQGVDVRLNGAYTLFTSVINNIGAVDYGYEDDGLRLFNNTTATAGTPLQASPNARFRSQGVVAGVNHVSEMIMTLVSATTTMLDGRPGHTLFWFSSVDGAAPTESARLTGNGNLITRSSVDSSYNNGDVGDVSTAANGGIYWREAGDTVSPSRVVMGSTARGKWRVADSNLGSRRVEINTGTAAVTCTAGCTPGTNANNSIGSATITGGAGSYTVTFASPSWTGTPICLIVNAGAGAVAPITAVSATVLTFTAAANGSFYWHCLGNA